MEKKERKSHRFWRSGAFWLKFTNSEGFGASVGFEGGLRAAIDFDRSLGAGIGFERSLGTGIGFKGGLGEGMGGRLSPRKTINSAILSFLIHAFS